MRSNLNPKYGSKNNPSPVWFESVELSDVEFCILNPPTASTNNSRFWKMFTASSVPAVHPVPLNCWLFCPTSDAVYSFHDPKNLIRARSEFKNGKSYVVIIACDLLKPAVE